MHRRTFISASMASLAGISASAPGRATESTVELVESQPSAGFNFPYLLRYPSRVRSDTITLMVEPNNSGHASLDFSEHLAAAQSLIRNGLGGRVSADLELPILMPVFPRGPDLYTHSLGRTTLETTDGRLRRLDRQLLAMIADALKRLAAWGQPVAPRVFLTGFSASGMFVTRFSALHPEAVQAVAAGGLNSYVILPIAALQGEPLPFHLGVGDMERYTGRSFQSSVWRRLPQYLFMGGTDTNDAVLYDDAYSPSERELIFRLVGREMPHRWETCRQIYADAGAGASFETYPGLGHGTNGRVHADVASFLASHAAPIDAKRR